MAARTFDKEDFLMLVNEQERKHIREEENTFRHWIVHYHLSVYMIEILI